MNQCTWTDRANGRCRSEGLFPQIADDGGRWAFLCGPHEDELDCAVAGAAENPKRMLSCWVKAQGGPGTATARMKLQPLTDIVKEFLP